MLVGVPGLLCRVPDFHCGVLWPVDPRMRVDITQTHNFENRIVLKMVLLLRLGFRYWVWAFWFFHCDMGFGSEKHSILAFI
jgi:hypothetical protein